MISISMRYAQGWYELLSGILT